MPKAPLAQCDECPLKDRPCAPTDGPDNSPVVFVSRSPGYHEAVAGRPFSGPSGKVLDHLLKLNGTDRKKIRTTNVVLCAPKDNDVPLAAIKACLPRLKAEVENAELIIAAGSEAVKVFCRGMSIDRARGYTHESTTGQRIVATNNPALVLRDDSTYPNLVKDFARAFHPKPAPTFPTVKVIEDANGAKRCLDYLSSYPVIAADIESRGGLTHKATLISLQFSVDGRTAYVLGERSGLWTDTDFLDGHLRPFFENTDNHFCWHNGIFDTKILNYTYKIGARVDHDTILMSYSLDERPGYHSLEYLLMEEFDWPKYEDDETAATKKTGIVTNYEKFYDYAGWDVAGTYQLYEHFLPKLEELEYV